MFWLFTNFAQKRRGSGLYGKEDPASSGVCLVPGQRSPHDWLMDVGSRLRFYDFRKVWTLITQRMSNARDKTSLCSEAIAE